VTEIALGPEVDDRRQVAGDPRVVRNVTRPVLTAFLPDGRSGGPAVLIAPGGGFHMLSLDTEGHQLAELIQAEGVAAYVLEYRLIPTPVPDLEFATEVGPLFADVSNPVELMALVEEHRPTFRADGLAALRAVRGQHDLVAMVGFSAGGILLADLLAGTELPDLAACIYTPFLTPAEAPEGAPPLFVLAAQDDPFGVRGSLDLQAVWARAGRPVDLHLFAAGGHGFGTTATGHPVDAWPDLLLTWLARNGVT
jgi:acetyl esterase/lipase